MQVVARELSKHYATPAEPLVVLDKVDLELERGDSLAVTGPSGSGKSTLLHILGTLEERTAGSLELCGVDPSRLSAAKLAAFRNREIGFVFQEHFLLPQCTALENVLLPALVAPPEPGREAWARELLDRVGLGARLGHRPAELSGGERQRVAVARALVLRPALLLCDEPTGSLDAASADRVGDLLASLHRELGAGLIVVTHSDDLARRFRRRAELRGGRLVEAALAAEA